MTPRERELEQLVARSGIRQQMAQEDAAARRATHAAAGRQKAEAKAIHAKVLPAALGRRAEADRKAAEAQKAANEAFKDSVKAIDEVSTLNGTLSNVLEPAEKIMRQHCDPQIDETKAQIAQIKENSPNLYRSWPDEAGKRRDLNGKPVSDNSEAIHKRIVACVDAMDACERLKVDETVSDVPAALVQIVAAIPEA